MQWNDFADLRAGAERVMVVFAYIPIKCNKGHKHWLENVKVRQFWGSYTRTWRPLGTEGCPGRKECYCPSDK